MRLLRVALLMSAVLVGNAIAVNAQSESSATLSGANEVPSVSTIGFGLATFDVNLSGNVLGIDFELWVSTSPTRSWGTSTAGFPERTARSWCGWPVRLRDHRTPV